MSKGPNGFWTANQNESFCLRTQDRLQVWGEANSKTKPQGRFYGFQLFASLIQRPAPPQQLLSRLFKIPSTVQKAAVVGWESVSISSWKSTPRVNGLDTLLGLSCWWYPRALPLLANPLGKVKFPLVSSSELLPFASRALGAFDLFRPHAQP